ncbi:centrosomal protein of 131 kDa isoform X1 [Drosophila sulfurigaster albostrigata]|uniref:centrosomal protein of 131 kDa isoform X1 n=1 Tax=Drosophila sulfurigaster albostrigata TaxID=89887 RepID=UPI002D21DD8C|nr:centrosomal protein of 131 kDa isoform X1 [Drosophila sulfurigaster albostrigata]
MDLCLKGSQINLATRQKTRPKLTSRSLTTLNNSVPHFRPRSANFLHQRSRSSPFLGRPQSADPKFGRKLSVYFAEKDLRTSKHRQVSSTDLLKSLLDEPIKRSWLCRSGCNSSTDDQSDCSQKSPHNSEGEHLERFMASMPESGSSDKLKSYASNWSARQAGLSNATLLQKTAKPDLPGRVSFSKPNMHNDMDSSDCDNDKQDMRPGSSSNSNSNISAPGPLTLPSFIYNNNSTGNSNGISGSSKLDAIDTGAQKKSVHFGTSVSAGSSAEVLAETYEYPKCPSENCTCSTRSSSTASTNEAASDAKCACDAPSCRYADSEPEVKTSTTPIAPSSSLAATRQKSPTPELNVIREYKQAVGGTLDNNLLSKTKSLEPMNNVELPNYLEKYAAQSKDQKQNNLSEKNLSSSITHPNNNNNSNSNNNSNNGGVSSYRSTGQRNFGAENNFLPLVQDDRRQYSTSSNADSVISNYLKVAATTPFVGKKKENVKPASAETSSRNSKPKFLTKSSISSTGAKLKKAVSVGSLREERKLSEYNLDKVDSWMSMQEQKQALAQFEELHKQGVDEMDDSNSQLSLKSNEDSRDSTYDEIVSVIKEIEEDKKRDNFAERLPSELNLKLDSRSETAETVSNDDRVPESGDKYKDILAYLNNVESSCDKTLMETRRSMPDSNRSEVEFVVEPDVTDEVPKLSELLMLPNHQLARRVIALTLRANELANAIHMSKEHVLQLRSEKQKLLRAEKSSNAIKLRDQKKHYEEVVTRHQGFIEQLLKDKGSLCEKVAALTRRLESQNQAWEHRLETELTRAKETTLAGEKIRRERWVRENTKKIKELTVKGLEAEINKMNCNHQREVTDLKRSHQMQLLDALEEARLKHEQIENGIRESCAQDREAIIEKERNAIRERLERQLEEEQKTQAELRQKLADDFAAERERLQAELRQKECDYQVKRQEAQREQDGELEQAKFEMQEKMSKQEEKYQNRINTIEQQYLADFELWKTEYENKCKLANAEKENAIRQHYRAERDRQLDELVVRMEADALQSGEEHEQKMLRLKEKYEKDLTLAENVEKSLREKYAEIRGKLAESDAQVRNSQAEVQQLHLELGHSKKMCGDIINERDKLRDNLNTDIQNEVALLNERHKQEMEQLQKRVHQTIHRQEETIDVLKGDNDNLRQQCLKLNAVIRQQRKDYCVK